MNWKTDFKNKRITMLGLGLLGRGVNVAKFLAEQGATLTVTDLKTKEVLEPSLKQLKKFSNITFVLGEHRLEDFKDKDMVIKAAGVPLDSPYIREAKKNNIPVEMDASLFSSLAPGGVTIVGITGTRGKSTVTQMIYETLKLVGERVYLGGNVRGTATLPLIKKVKAGDVVVLELDSWQLQGFGDAKLSPNISVFTTFMDDHMNYYKGDIKQYAQDKANIFKYQKEDDVAIFGRQAKDALKKLGIHAPKNAFVAEALPKGWKLKIPGEHNRYNAGIARAALRALGVSDTAIKKSFAKFAGVPGRLELVAKKKGITFYNDTTATTPDGVLAAFSALKQGSKRNIILLGGGADKGIVYDAFVKKFQSVKSLILFKGAATDKITSLLPGRKVYEVNVVSSMKEAFDIVRKQMKRGDIVLLSPAAASFGVFNNEFDRGDQFVREVKKIK
jgi:UDP-N-acetylmuramoylalanine--D-glutamate ligase